MKTALCLLVAVGLSFGFSVLVNPPDWVNFFVGVILGLAAMFIGKTKS